MELTSAYADLGSRLGRVSRRSEVSVAFALWDGAFRDRGGQKQISIWNNLKLE